MSVSKDVIKQCLISKQLTSTEKGESKDVAKCDNLYGGRNASSE